MRKYNLKNNKGYVDGELIGAGVFFTLVAIFIIGVLVCIFGNLCLDFAGGSHRITPTAVDKDMWGNYKVYYRTSQYTQNAQEDYYYIDKNDKELANQMTEYVRKGKEVVVYYEEYIGLKGISAPKSSPIKKIEPVEETEEE